MNWWIFGFFCWRKFSAEIDKNRLNKDVRTRCICWVHFTNKLVTRPIAMIIDFRMAQVKIVILGDLNASPSFSFRSKIWKNYSYILENLPGLLSIFFRKYSGFSCTFLLTRRGPVGSGTPKSVFFTFFGHFS